MRNKILFLIVIFALFFFSGCETKDNTDNKINNQVLVNNNDCIITITEAYNDSIWGFTLKVLSENKTSNKKLMFSLETAVVNGYEVDPLWVESVEAGKKSNSEITFSSSILKDCGITSLDKIELYIRVYDYDDWFADEFVDDKFTVYPTGLSEQDIKSPDRPSREKEYVVVNDENCTFIILETYDDSIWGYSLKCYLENKTNETEFMFSFDDVSVNGFMIDPFWAKSLMPGSKTVSSISFSNSDFEDNGITDVSEIEFLLRVYDDNYILEDDFINSTFTYHPNN